MIGIRVSRCLIVMALWFVASESAIARHTDLAPLPDDVVSTILLDSGIHQNDSLPTTIGRHLDEANTLVAEIERLEEQDASAEKIAAKRALLEAKIQELKVLKGNVLPFLQSKKGQDHGVPAPASARDLIATRLSEGVGQRFDEVIESLQNIVSEKTKQGRLRTTANARTLLQEKYKKYQQQDKLVPDDQPAFKVDKPTTMKPEDIPGAPVPEYVSWQRRAAGNMYAFLGNTLLTAAPPATPTDALTCSYASADLASSIEVQLTPEIKQLAEKLGYSPVKIFQFVSNEIKYESYFGSLKGAVATLQSGAGNPTDQASLLISLLRASNIPARYVTGTIRFDNDDRVLRWLGAKSYAAAASILARGQIPVASGTTSLEISHVWVEACVPYGNYRGTAVDTKGHRWIALDPSFKEKKYQNGIQTNVAFDYNTFLAKRLNGPDSLPQEAYSKQVESAIKSMPPLYGNNTIQDARYVGTQVPLNVDILPASLPYDVKTFNSWGTGLTAEVAELPATRRVTLTLSTTNISTAVKLNMSDIALNRLTLSYKAATTTDQTRLDAYLNNGTLPIVSPCYTTSASCGLSPINLIPVIKVEGVEKAVGTKINLFMVTSLAVSGGQLVIPSTLIRKNSLTMTMNLNTTVLNSTSFSSKISMLDHYALQAYAFQVSDRLLAERAKKLITTVTSITDPNTDKDNTIGEFLHLVGLKYVRYVDDATRRIAELTNNSGLPGNHLGVVSSKTTLQYLFDLPYAVAPTQRALLVDMPGFLSRGVDLNSGKTNWDVFLLSGYAASAYESYMWQENARLDAVSTVRGLQFARETGIEVLTLSSATPSLATELAKLTSNANTALNYSTTEVSYILSQINAGHVITLPRSYIKYENWQGKVYVDVLNDTVNGKMTAGYIIGGDYSGGESVGNYASFNYNSYMDTGWSCTAPMAVSQAVPPVVMNSLVGNGSTSATTFSGDPVNMVTGNMYHTERDISLKGRGLPIVFERSYNSRDAKDGPLGFGWTHSFNHSLQFVDDNSNGTENEAVDKDNLTSTVIWTDGTGGQKFINVAGASGGVATGSTFTAPKGYYFSTVRNPDGTYSIREKNGLTYVFESIAGTVGQKAKLLKISDRNGNSLTLGYTAGLLSSVKDDLGRTLNFYYNGSRINQITDWASRSYVYQYDADGNLVQYLNPRAYLGKQNPVSYAYYSAADGTNLNHAMKNYTLPKGNGMTFEYYLNGRVFRHYTTKGETISFTYNDYRRESVSINERGFERRFFFNENGLPIKIIEENGSVREYTYDTANPFNRKTSRDPMGYVTRYDYDILGNVTKITNPSGSTVEYSYFDTFNLPRKTKDARGNYTLSKTDAKGNVTDVIRLMSGVGATVDPVSYVPVVADVRFWTKNTFDSYGNVLTNKQMRDFTTQVGPTVEFNYNDTGNGNTGLNLVGIIRRGDKDGNGTIDTTEFDSVTMSYDNLGRVKQGVSKNWYSTQAEYDEVDRVVRGTDALGKLRDYYYDVNGNSVGNALIDTDANGVRTTVDLALAMFDETDRKQSQSDAAGSMTTYQYDASGNVIKVTSPDGYSLGFGYDANNNLVIAYDEEGNAVTKAIDLDGKPRVITDPNGNTVGYEYYAAERDGRLKKMIDGEGRATTYDYDGNGNVISVADNLGRTTSTSYDELNRPVRVVGPSYTDATYGVIRPVTRYSYDNLGNQTTVDAGRTDSTGTNVASDVVKFQAGYAYDDFGRKLKETDALSKSWVYTYDMYNNVQSVTDAKGQKTSYTWGYGNQMLTRTDHAGKLTKYTRNTLGQVQTVDHPETSYQYTYDVAHRVLTSTDKRNQYTRNYLYTPAGRLNEVLDSNGRSTNYLYDPVGRLAAIWAPNDAVVAFSYDAGGRLAAKWFPNGVNAQYSYNKDNTLAELVNRVGYTDYQALSRHSYQYDGIGNRKNAVEKIGPNAVPAMALAFGYDPLGNRTHRTEGTVTHYSIYDDANQLKEIRSGSLTGTLIAGFVYDANGNLTTKCEGTGVSVTASACTGSVVTNMAYDALNQLVQVSKTGQPTEQYGYDDQGRRVRKAVGTATSYYSYEGPDIAAEFDVLTSGATPRVSYVHGPNTDDPILRMAANDAYYYHQDGLGSVVALTGANGATVAQQQFDAWGNRLGGVSAGVVPQYGYTGREPDDTGLIYYRARYLDPTIGRFVSRDPIGLDGGINQYAYVNGNPVNYTDPTGLFAAFKSYNNNALTQATSYFSMDSIGFSSASTQLFSVGSASSEGSDWARMALGASGPTASNNNVQLAGLASPGCNGGVGTSSACGFMGGSGAGSGAGGGGAGGLGGLGGAQGFGAASGARTYQTYTRTNPETGNVYSGRTSGTGTPQENIVNRNRNSPLNNNGYGPPVLDRSSPNPAAIRGREQQLIESNGGALSTSGSSANKINGISPSNPKGQFYRDEATREFGIVKK